MTNYHNPDIVDHLASSYVLRTLKGGALRRFEKQLVADPALQRAVVKWDSVFAPTMLDTKPIKPPQRVWNNVSERLWGESDQQSGQQLQKLGRRLFMWKTAAAFASVTAVALMVPLYKNLLEPPSATAYLAIIQGEDAKPRWLIRQDEASQQLLVEQLTPSPIPSVKDHELWLLGAAGEKPVSLGLLPGDQQKITLAINQSLLASATGFAVSLEPTGGSPTGQPTGPVLYQGALSKQSA